MEDPIFSLLEKLGPFGIVAVALFYVVRMAREMAPSENVQTQMFGFMKQQLDLVSDLKSAIERGDERNASALDKFTAFMETFTQRVSSDHQQTLVNQSEHRNLIDAVQQSVNKVDTKVTTITGAVDSMMKKQNDKTDTELLQKIYQELKDIREENKRHYEQTEKRLVAIEAAVPPLKNIASKGMDTQPTPSSDDTHSPLSDPAVKPYGPTVSFSKTQAKQNQVTPVIKPDDNEDDNDKSAPDLVPTV